MGREYKKLWCGELGKCESGARPIGGHLLQRRRTLGGVHLLHQRQWRTHSTCTLNSWFDPPGRQTRLSPNKMSKTRPWKMMHSGSRWKMTMQPECSPARRRWFTTPPIDCAHGLYNTEAARGWPTRKWPSQALKRGLILLHLNTHSRTKVKQLAHNCTSKINF